MTTIITGATGFVGKNLTAYLSLNQLSFLDLNRFELENSDFSKLAQADTIVHLAGKAHDVKNQSNAEVYNYVNFELTKKLFDAFLVSKARAFIFISSVKASADHIATPLTEAGIPNPKTPYGISKLRAEQYIQDSALPLGKVWYILRPCMIHGVGNKGNLNLLFQLISKKLPYPLAAFENRRSFLSVENLCFVIHQFIVRDDIPKGIYQVADDQTLSTNDLIKLIAQASGVEPKLWRLNKDFIRSIARLGDIFKLPLNSDRLNKLTENYVVDNQKLKKTLHIELPVAARAGILQTIDSFVRK